MSNGQYFQCAGMLQPRGHKIHYYEDHRQSSTTSSDARLLDVLC